MVSRVSRRLSIPRLARRTVVGEAATGADLRVDGVEIVLVVADGDRRGAGWRAAVGLAPGAPVDGDASLARRHDRDEFVGDPLAASIEDEKVRRAVTMAGYHQGL